MLESEYEIMSVLCMHSLYVDHGVYFFSHNNNEQITWLITELRCLFSSSALMWKRR